MKKPPTKVAYDQPQFYWPNQLGISCHQRTKFIQFYLSQTDLTPAITLFNSAAYLPQTVPAVVAVVKAVTEDKALPQTRPPLVTAAIELAAMAAVSAPGI